MRQRQTGGRFALTGAGEAGYKVNNIGTNKRFCQDIFRGPAIDDCQFTLYKPDMIARFRHRGLRRFYEDDDRSGVRPDHADKIARILARLKRAAKPSDMDLPDFRLHPLKGDLSGFWSVTVRANWRIIFRFDDGHVTDVDLIDYH